MSRPTPIHGVFCNRTLNLRSIAAIGYDMDYTLIHYRVEHWERKAYEHIRAKLQELGWPVQSLEFDPGAMVRGLVVDTKLGNVVKADRFGYVKRAVHGAGVLDFDIQRKNYARTAVDLSENRWKFLNTLFSLSGACMYSQLVELLDRGELPGAIGYDELYDVLSSSLNAAHMEGLLKKEIMEAPEKFVDSDPDTVLTLLDQRNAGKKLLLITNSEWNYTKEMMEFAFDRHLPNELTWRDIFDVIIVGARKPAFFSDANPFFEVVSPEGLLQPAVGGLKPGGVFLGGNAEEVERYIGVSGDSILYVGDHMFSDVKVTKNLLRWRTALIVRELEDEIAAVQEFSTTNEKLTT
ncbi:MAG: HAD-IG family 5'-nucleotidase [Gemmatimonadota bacterium]|nr:HAD-IG family 5'-nucleotidase [Gemmatimonadota bacterium]